MTTFLGGEPFSGVSFGFAVVAAAAAAFFVFTSAAVAFLDCDFLAGAFFGLTGGSSFGASAAAALLESRADRRVGAMVRDFC